jgi:hypothetical protein
MAAMNAFDLQAFADAFEAQADQWSNAGIQWQFHRGPTDRPKWAAWVVCETTTRKAQLTVWTSGDAELDLTDLRTNFITPLHHQIHNQREVVLLLNLITGWVQSYGPLTQSPPPR